MGGAGRHGDGDSDARQHGDRDQHRAPGGPLRRGTGGRGHGDAGSGRAGGQVGLAVLSLLSDVAAEQPVLCLIDDAQWLDRTPAQLRAFVARRLEAESVAMIFGTRDPGAAPGVAGLPELALEGLSDPDACALLDSVIPGRLDERVRDRIVAESGGNPLALLELPRAVNAAELAGGFGLPGALALTSRIEQSFRRRIAPLPAATRRLKKRRAMTDHRNRG
jgi:hypothetical protein